MKFPTWPPFCSFCGCYDIPIWPNHVWTGLVGSWHVPGIEAFKDTWLTKSGDAVTRKHPLDTQVVMGKFSSHVRFPEGRFNHWKEKAGMWWVNHWWNDSLQLVAGIYHVQAIFKTNHRAANQLMSSGIINVLVDSGNHTWAAFKNALNKFIKELTFFLIISANGK